MFPHFPKLIDDAGRHVAGRSRSDHPAHQHSDVSANTLYTVMYLRETYPLLRAPYTYNNNIISTWKPIRGGTWFGYTITIITYAGVGGEGPPIVIRYPGPRVREGTVPLTHAAGLTGPAEWLLYIMSYSCCGGGADDDGSANNNKNYFFWGTKNNTTLNGRVFFPRG